LLQKNQKKQKQEDLDFEIEEEDDTPAQDRGKNHYQKK
jgi:hypothetical protein